MTGPQKNGDTQWTDSPLAAGGVDELGRAPFIKTVAARIDRARANDPSTVFGLVGEWGCGKSSVIAQIKPVLAGDWVIADFTPWSSGDAAAMSLEFVSTLASALDVEATGEGRAKFARYAGFVAPLLNAIPLGGAAVAGTANKVLSELASRPPWHQQFEELSQAVREHAKRVLIIIDDVDRLGPVELTNLLRIVRLLGRFEGVHYLMAYDQTTVEDLLSSSGAAGRATSFMEKIVQYPFEVPPIPRATAVRLTQDLLAELVTETRTRLDEVDLERQAELAQVLASMITTPRTLGRYRSQLLAFAKHVREAELDVFDYAAVTWVRLEAHEVWRCLPKWRSEMNTGARSAGLMKSEKITPDEWKRRIAEVAVDTDPLDVLRVLELIFPGISSTSVSSFYQHPRSVSEEAYIGRYLLLALPEDDVSDALIEEALADIDAGRETASSQRLEQLIDGPEQLASLAVSRGMDRRREASAASRGIIDFLITRVQNGPESPPAPSPLLKPWLAREVALGIEQENITPPEVVAKVGRAESISLVSQFASVWRDSERAKRDLHGFAEHWISELTERPQDLLGDARLLTGAVELINYVGLSDRIEGTLDPLITDLESYLQLAMAFVRFRRWVGGNIVTYEMAFQTAEFATAVSAQTREKFLGDVKTAKNGIAYETDELREPEVGDAQLREYVVDCLLAFAANR